MSPPELRTLEMESPVGVLLLTASEAALTGIYLRDRQRTETAAQPNEVLLEARRQLEAYFRGERTSFELPLAPHGTDFQQRVWRALLEIPFGETWSYRQLAVSIGRPTATRAVGASNGRNPISIVIPCHRVIGADGTLTGYGGGLPMKRWLLEHESRGQRSFALPLP